MAGTSSFILFAAALLAVLNASKSPPEFWCQHAEDKEAKTAFQFDLAILRSAQAFHLRDYEKR
ncbi:hypothetical protein [Rhizobium mongolense]|uniref:hypothetical protein n=1 Tax=Rhizobium mongolense TaxID=57676 RepID=UPI0011136FC1|nr:hypothetical protein [Rhizobium mongolense]